MRQLLQVRYIFILFLFLGTTAFYSCDKDMNVSLDNSNETLGVSILDSITVYTSNYQLNNLPSASNGTLLIGKVNNALTGSIKSTPYFRVNLFSVTNDIPTDAVYDSITLVIKPNQNKYHYGDTSRVQNIAVHRVTQDITTKDIINSIDNYNTPVYVTSANIFTDQKFTYDSQPLGQVSFTPTLSRLNELSIRLNDNLGSEIYAMIKENNWTMNSDESFQQYIKGFALVPGDDNTLLWGLKDTVRVNINYSYTGTDGFKKSESKVLMSVVNSLQYNNIEYDRSGTPFAALNNTTKREITANETGGKLVVQSGSGIVAKMSIPSLNEFMYQDNIAVNKAELIVEVEGNTAGSTPVPSSMMLMLANSNNLPFAYMLAPFSSSAQQSSFIPGNDTGVNGRYVFNLIEYIKNINNSEYKNTSLLLSVTSPSLFNTANAAVIATENGKPKIKLNIVYTKFK